jgi:hypothetical protein
MQQVGGSIGTALLNTLAATAAASFVTSHVGHTAPNLLQAGAQLHSFVVTFWVSAAIFAVGAVLVGLILRPGLPDFGPVDETAAGALVVA